MRRRMGQIYADKLFAIRPFSVVCIRRELIKIYIEVKLM